MKNRTGQILSISLIFGSIFGQTGVKGPGRGIFSEESGTKSKLFPKNLREGASMKEYRITRDKFLEPDEVKRLMTTCEDKALADVAKGRKTWVTRFMLIHLVLYSGLRVSEVALLRVGDLRLNGKNPYLVVQRGKGGKKRDVYIDRGLVKHIREYLTIRQDAWGESVENDAQAWLFANASGKIFTTAALHQSFKKALTAAGMEGRCSIHGARHTYSTILLAKTGNIRFVQKQLGHASLNMTSLYADVLPEQNSTLANAIIEDGGMP